jgi:type II secretory ATPase GspE/PulE/Tfp pilus assembly ATPase PilB-like protein
MEGRSSAEIQQHARDSGMTTILEDGLIKVEQGLTTRDDVFRVGH